MWQRPNTVQGMIDAWKATLRDKELIMGRALRAWLEWTAPFNVEGGKGSTGKVVKFQLRPNPLAR
jgi:hypothetical protein